MAEPKRVTRATRRSLKLSSAEIAALQDRIRELDGNIRGMLINTIVDLEIAAGTKRETDRADTILTLSDKRRYPKESLEELRRVMVGVLHSRTAKDLPAPEPQPKPTPTYVQ